MWRCVPKATTSEHGLSRTEPFLPAQHLRRIQFEHKSSSIFRRTKGKYKRKIKHLPGRRDVCVCSSTPRTHHNIQLHFIYHTVEKSIQNPCQLFRSMVLLWIGVSWCRHHCRRWLSYYFHIRQNHSWPLSDYNVYVRWYAAPVKYTDTTDRTNMWCDAIDQSRNRNCLWLMWAIGIFYK